jgi:fimbrial isopeptide formation D2 family protein
MKKMFKRTTAIAASALMLTQMVPYNVFAEPAVTGPNSLYIHPYLLDDDGYSDAKTASQTYTPTGTEADEDHANIFGSDTESEDILFTVTEVTSDGRVKSGGVSKPAGQDFTGLPDGYYKITAANGTTDDDFQGIESFFIALPSGDNRTVHIYPKLTNNHDNGDNNTPDTVIDPEDPSSTDKHSIELTKLLSDDAEWDADTMEATFQVYSKDTMGNWVDCGTHDVRSDGKLHIDGLPYGEYYLYETAAPGGYLKSSEPIKFILDGTTSSKQKADFYNDQILKVAKTIDADGGGHEYNWTITADLPDKHPENLMSYSVTDTYTNLDSVAISSVKVGSTTLTAGDDYHTTTTDNSITVVIDNLDALNDEGGSVVIKVTSVIPNDYSVDDDGNVTNSSSLSYQYAYDPDDDPDIISGDIPEDIPGLPDPNPEDPEDPSNPPVISYPGTTPDPDTIVTVTPGTITIKNVDFEDEDHELTDGAYFVPGCSNHYDSDEAPYVATVTNMAPGVYEIRQTGTQAGYKTADPITIYIDANGQAYLGESDDPANALDGNVVTFKNMKDASGFQLPFTGTTATIVFTVTGIAIMAGAAFFIIILFKKRDEEEEEQKNA